MAADVGVRDDILAHSVTEGDVLTYQPGSGGVANFVLPFLWFQPYQIGELLPDLPAYWSDKRDMMLRSTILHESFWSAAVAIASVKAASQSTDFDGPPRLVSYSQELMLQWSGEGYVPSQEKGVYDFLCQDNGEFHEIVRVSNAAGSRILGLVHLDSARCLRTGDPSIPVLYRDLHGYLHEMRDYQIISLADQPDPGSGWFGVGHSAASRAYTHIFRLAAIERFITEKITGMGASKMTFIKGITTEALANLIANKSTEAKTKGLIYYQGSILAGILTDIPFEKIDIELRGLPDGFDREQEMNLGLLAYADAIGLDPQDLQPLSSAGFGTGTQSRVLFEKSKGRWPSARTKQLTHVLMERVFPQRVTFSFHERDLADEMQEAQVVAERAQARATMIGNGEITPQQSQQMAADNGDIPAEFIPNEVEVNEQVTDEERTTTDQGTDGTPTGGMAPGVVAPAASTAPASATKPTGKSVLPPNVARALITAASEIRGLRQEVYRERLAAVRNRSDTD
jgi:hypothetical protein